MAGASTSAAATATQGQYAPQAPVPRAPTPTAPTSQFSQPAQSSAANPPVQESQVPASPAKPQVLAPSSVQKEDSVKGSSHAQGSSSSAKKAQRKKAAED
ncbi:hypothetical protein U1Q18_025612 [Sarracenia purpurea var. burkii]